MSEQPWWRGSVIYQIYPRSFYDSNGDGIGDLPGVLAKLDYIASLGVDAIWISPFFKSPMADFGYDIADYREVDPMFGSLADFDAVLSKAHALGLKVMIDQVLSHTSSEHAWFKASRVDRHNPMADWYVWADAKPDGSPPNNWLSIFGGVAWQWESRRCQYYLHNFLTSQPDLNFHCPAVQQAALDNVEFWLQRGVDGFRLDAINFCFHDALLRDNPAKPEAERTGRGFSADNPYAFQYHYYNNTQPENLAFLERLRALLDRYPGSTALGEISSEDSLATMAEYTGDTRLQMGYSFELLTRDCSATYIRETIENFEARVKDGWPCWAISNHDVERVATRWGNGVVDSGIANQLSALVCSLRGSVCVYQGEELGLPEAEIPFEALQDPFGIAFWPTFKGRDGCRTPMPWQNAADGGFTTGKAWLPIAGEHLALSVAIQEQQADSTLHGFRRFMRWRQTQSALRLGSIRFYQISEPLLGFVREYQGEKILCVFNLSGEAASATHPQWQGAESLLGHGLRSGTLESATGQMRLPARGVVYARLAS
jgi:alpha-glucosidase